MSGLLQPGIIPAGGVLDINVGGREAPFTATLASTAGGRSIAFASSANGEMSDPVTPDTTGTAMINFAFLSPVRTVRFTGNPGDYCEVR